MGIGGIQSQAKIGDYIHLRKANYNAVGWYRGFEYAHNKDKEKIPNAKKESPSRESAIEAAYTRLNFIKNSILTSSALNYSTNGSNNGNSNTEYSDIEKFYTALLRGEYGEADKIVGANGKLLKAKNTIEKNMEEYIFKETNYSINETWNRQKLEIKSYLSERMKNTNLWKKAVYKESKSGLINRNTLQKYLSDVRSALDSAKKTLRYDKKGLKPENIAQLNLIINKLNGIAVDLNQLLYDTVAKKPEYKDLIVDNSSGGLSRLRLYDSNGNKSAVGLIMNRIVEIQAMEGGLSTKKSGTAAECFGVMGAAMCVKKAKKNTYKLLSEELINKSNSNRRVTGGDISSNILTITASKEFNELVNDGKDFDLDVSEGTERLISKHPSSDTQDFIYEYEDDNNLFGIKEVSASVKSYANAFHSEIGILHEGVDVLQLLQILDANFANHYINLLVANGEGADCTISNSKFEEFTNIVKILSAVRGFLGIRYNGFNKTVNTFIAIDKSSKTVRVISTQKIIDHIISGGTDILNYDGIELLKENSISQTRESSVSTRIAKILAELHKIKIKVSINPTKFWSGLGY